MPDYTTLYISTNGSDTATGTCDAPFASFARALDAMRQSSRPVQLLVRGGTYELPETLVIDESLSGTGAAPTIVGAYPGERPVLSGGRTIGDWIVTEHKGQICWVATLPDVANGEWYFRQLFVNGERRFRPRLPKKGFYRFRALTGKDVGMDWGNGPNNVAFEPGQIQKWTNIEDVELVIYQLWFDMHHRVLEVDETASIVHFQAKSLGSLMDEQQKLARYYQENVFEALDEPGEWYLDRPTGRLYYLPLPGENPATTVVVAPRLETLLKIHGGRVPAAHLTIENLSFQHAEWAPPDDWSGSVQACFHLPGAVVFGQAEHCTLYGCEVSRVSQYAIQHGRQSHDCRTVACAMYDMGAGGVRVDHEWIHEPRVTVHSDDYVLPERFEKPRAALITDCTIHDGGVLYPSAIGIWIGNAGHNRVLHNHIFNMNYTGISCGWTWGYAETATVANHIDYNHIHHINWPRQLSDNGGIYTLGRQPGSTVRGNHVHHIDCYGYGGWGIYPDEGSAEILFEDNLVHHTKHAAYSCHYGRGLVIRNNIFAYSQACHILPANRHEAHRAGTFTHNIIAYRQGVMNGAGYAGKGWPLLISDFHDNCIWPHVEVLDLGGGRTLADVQRTGNFANTRVADPLFADPDGDDFSLRADTPAMEIGFVPFDTQAAGIRPCSSRPSAYADWPYDKGASSDRPILSSYLKFTGSDRVCLHVVNRGTAPGDAEIELQVTPPGALRFVDKTQLSIVGLAPGASIIREWHFAIAPNIDGCTIETIVESDSLLPDLVYLNCRLKWDVPLLPATADLVALDAQLDTMPAREIRDGETLMGSVQVARVGGSVCVRAQVRDIAISPCLAQPWMGSCVEIYIGPDQPSKKLVQCFLVPDGELLKISRLEGTGPAPLEGATGLLRYNAQGYVALVCIPFAVLPVSPSPMELSCEISIVSHPTSADQRRHTTLFGSTHAASRVTGYGSVTFVAAAAR